MAHTAVALEEQKKRNKILGEDFYKEQDVENNHSTTLTQRDKINKTTKGLTNDLLLGVIGGGLAGAVLGKYSFFAGLALAGYGHYSDNKLLGTVGLGMMATGTASALLGGKAQNSKLSKMEQATERIKGFTNELKRKVWIDKWDSPEGLNGFSNSASINEKGKIDFTKNVEPIDPNKFAKLSKEEEEALDKELNNAGALAINQFYEKRHNLNGVNDASTHFDKLSGVSSATASTGSETKTKEKSNNEKEINDLENELKKATEANNSKQTNTSTTNGVQNSTKQNHSTNNESDFNDDDLSGNIEDYMSDNLKKEFYKNQSSNESNQKSYKNKSWDDSMDVADKLF